MISDSVIQRLRQARAQAGVTLTQIAEITGYAITTLSSVENGHDQPSKRLLDKWTQALSINKSWLASGEGEPFEAKDPCPVVAPKDLAAPTRSRIRHAREQAAELLRELELLENEFGQPALGGEQRPKRRRRSAT
jgi:transcriptional regulator with XRE-family HTH domain